MTKKKQYTKEDVTEALSQIYAGNFDDDQNSTRINELIQTISESVQRKSLSEALMFTDMKKDFDSYLYDALSDSIDIDKDDLKQVVDTTVGNQHDFADKFADNFEDHYKMPVDAFVGFSDYHDEIRNKEIGDTIPGMELKLDYSRAIEREQQKAMGSVKLNELQNDFDDLEPIAETEPIDETEADLEPKNKTNIQKQKDDYDLDL